MSDREVRPAGSAKRPVIGFSTLVFFFAAAAGLSAEPMDFSADTRNCAPHLEILRGNVQSWEEARLSQAWTQNRGGDPSLGVTTEVVWFRITFLFQEASDFVLQIESPNVTSIEAFQIPAGGSQSEPVPVQLGRSRPMQEAGRLFTSPYLAAQAPAGQTTFYFRVKSDAGLRFPLRIYRPGDFDRQHDLMILVDGVFFGALFIMAIYNFFIFLSTRERAYGLYVLLILSSIFLFAAQLGSLVWLFPQLETFYQFRLLAAGTSLYLTLVGLFVRSFLRTKKSTLVEKGITCASLLALVTLILVPFRAIPFPFYPIMNSANAVVLFILVPWAGIRNWRSGYKPARFILYAFLALGAGAIAYILHINGIIPFAQSAENGLRLGVLAQGVLFSLALADQIKQMRTELRTLADGLEEKVRERTMELETAREQAEAGDRAKGRFLANMSHELRTPLQAIIGYSDLIRCDPYVEKGGDRLVNDVKKIQNAGNHLLEVINNVLDFSAIEAGKTNLVIESFDVVPLITESVETLQPLADRNKNRIVFHRFEDVLIMKSDKTRLRQILFNLLSNACKFTESGDVRITLGAEGGNCRIEVSDTGRGMTPESAETAFQPFERIESKSNQGGTGLGLTIVRELCLMLGGEISVVSARGIGSVFTVTLPIEIPETGPGNGAAA